MDVSEFELVAVDEIEPHPDNPRRADLEPIKESMRVHGFYGSLVVQRSTGRILAGNHRYRAARELGHGEVPVRWIDVDDEQARKILLVDNRTSDIALYDDKALAELLESLGSFEGTGYDDDALKDLLAKVAGPPDLDELAQVLGDPTPEDFWPIVRFRVPPDMLERYKAAMDKLDIDEGRRFANIVDLLEAQLERMGL